MPRFHFLLRSFLLLSAFVSVAINAASVVAQEAPTPAEILCYLGLHRAAATGDIAAIEASSADTETKDWMGRTAFHIAAYQRQHAAMRALVKKGANPNALEIQAFDALTIAAAADDVETLKVALALGDNPSNATSPEDGTALIAAAHQGNDEVVRVLIEAGAPLDHVNNMGWTALLEAIILGDGGPRHQKTVEYLVKAGANKTIADNNGITPLQHARQRGYYEIVRMLE